MDDEDSIKFEKDKLSRNLEFILQMLKETRGTEQEEKWRTVHKCITSDKTM